ncbi:hypothetical protein BJY00DRAFT_46292 [Aspergillus carlsbadensis]|nr:hypothetical protein BJY00DRAFT_46292 [Aspergillus carlsbadensis]
MLFPCWNGLIWRVLFVQKEPKIPGLYSDIERLLHRTPSIQASPEFLENTDRTSLYLEGYIEWSVLSDKH